MSDFPYSEKDLEVIEGFWGGPDEYYLKNHKISKKCYDLIKNLISQKTDQVKITYRVREHSYSTEYKSIIEWVSIEELAMVDQHFSWEEYMTYTPPIRPCNSPYKHIFEKKAYTTYFFHECKLCGYSPEFDGNKPEFRECHAVFIEWERVFGKKRS